MVRLRSFGKPRRNYPPPWFAPLYPAVCTRLLWKYAPVPVRALSSVADFVRLGKIDFRGHHLAPLPIITYN